MEVFSPRWQRANIWTMEEGNRKADGKTQCWGFETDKEIRKESPNKHQEWRRAITPERGSS